MAFMSFVKLLSPLMEYVKFCTSLGEIKPYSTKTFECPLYITLLSDYPEEMTSEHNMSIKHA